MKKNVTAIIQARMKSTRLPGKSMRDLAGKPLIAHVVERTQAIVGVDIVVLATSEGAENHPIIACAESMGAAVFTGSENNVLERYFMAAERFGGDYIVRVTGDNPFTDPWHGARTLEHAVQSGADLCSPLGLPLGTAVEIFSRKALERAYLESTEPHQKEHVSPYIKEHEELFTVVRYNEPLPCSFPRLRLTVDTEDDYRVADILYSALYRGGPFSTEDVLRYIEKNPEVAEINIDVVQRSMKHYEKQS
ncbi:MAG TPA: glycosyltransferase family protein [Spirochaetota bacterium]|nr:glycosyltransferase family protein [Spirochaetota bacterium]HQO00995.1 glycosyltransferase family protein [Spirochaetota bacterium]HQP47306.1 glycosyltransferase family protein [Spirochaetota bacterium]